MKNQGWKWWLVSAALLCLRLAAFATQPNNEKECDDSLGIVFVSLLSRLASRTVSDPSSPPRAVVGKQVECLISAKTK
jgi:hypothetical protein